jgi:hypothetical protein
MGMSEFRAEPATTFHSADNDVEEQFDRLLISRCHSAPSR